MAQNLPQFLGYGDFQTKPRHLSPLEAVLLDLPWVVLALELPLNLGGPPARVRWLGETGRISTICITFVITIFDISSHHMFFICWFDIMINDLFKSIVDGGG